MSRSRSSEAREPYKSVLLLMAERGIKKCIDNLSTDPRLNRQTFKCGLAKQKLDKMT